MFSFLYLTDWIQSLKSFAVDKKIVNVVTGKVHSIVSLRYPGRQSQFRPSFCSEVACIEFFG